MSYVRMIEFEEPIGFPVSDPNFSFRNVLEDESAGFHRAPGIRVRDLKGILNHVTPDILKGRESWTVVIGKKGAILRRTRPPVNGNDPEDVLYAEQRISEDVNVLARIETPEDMVRNHYEMLPLSEDLQELDLPPRRLTTFWAAVFWFNEENDSNPEDMAVPIPVAQVQTPKEEIASSSH